MKQTVNIGIVEDHLLVRQGLMSLLNEYRGISILFDVGNGKDMLLELREHKPDVILLDIEMPVMNGKVALEKLRTRHTKIKVIVISSYYKDSYIVEFLKNGASAFLPKNAGVEKIVEAIFAVHEKGEYYDAPVAAIMAKTLKGKNELELREIKAAIAFTQRELQIMTQICKKKSNREIAETLDINLRTVEWHRTHIMKKAGCKDRESLLIYAVENNLVDLR